MPNNNNVRSFFRGLRQETLERSKINDTRPGHSPPGHTYACTGRFLVDLGVIVARMLRCSHNIRGVHHFMYE